MCPSCLLCCRRSPPSAQRRRRRRPRSGYGRRVHRRVADDATASWWNPAGHGRRRLFQRASSKRQLPRARTPTAPRRRSAAGLRADTRSFAVAFPALGLSYYRLRVSEIQPQTSTGTTPGVRQEGERRRSALRSRGAEPVRRASVGQSLGSHLVVGSTFKVVNAGLASAVRSSRRHARSMRQTTSIRRVRRTPLASTSGSMARVRPGEDRRDGAERPRSRSSAAESMPFKLTRTVRRRGRR